MRASGHSLNTSLCSSPVPLIVWPLTPPSAPPFTQKRELSRHQDCSDVPHRLCGVLGLLVKAQKSSLPRQAQAGRGPSSCSSDSQAWGGSPGEEIPSTPPPPPPRTLLKSQVTTVVTDSTPGVLSALAGPLCDRGKMVVPEQEAWRLESSGHPAPPQPSQTQLCWASTSGNRNLSLKRVIFIRQQLCLQNTFPYVCFQPREDGWGRIINPNLQLEKCSSYLRCWEQDFRSRS